MTIRELIRTVPPVKADYPSVVEELKRLRKEGWTKQRLAKRYGVPESIVAEVVGEGVRR